MSGILEIRLGFWVSQQFYPARGALLLPWIGFYGLFRGISEIALASQVRTSDQPHPKAVPTTSAPNTPHQKQENSQQTLSEHQCDPSERARRTGDIVPGPREKDRAELEAQRTELTTSLATAEDTAGKSAANAKETAEEWWSDTRSPVDQLFTTMHAQQRDATPAWSSGGPHSPFGTQVSANPASA